MTRSDRNRRETKPWEERFWSHVNKDAPNGCWEWTAYRTPGGYGQFNTRDPRVTTRFPHRIAWWLKHGSLPDFENGHGLELDHVCRNPSCCNPDHLEPVRHMTNLLRGDTAVARGRAQTHCVNGHPFDEKNTLWCTAKSGSRYRKCRTCTREKGAVWYAQKQNRDRANASRRARYDPARRRERRLRAQARRSA